MPDEESELPVQGGGKDDAHSEGDPKGDIEPSAPARVRLDEPDLASEDKVDVIVQRFAKAFTTTRSSHIPWTWVYRRKTMDLSDGRVIADESNVQEPGKTQTNPDGP